MAQRSNQRDAKIALRQYPRALAVFSVLISMAGWLAAEDRKQVDFERDVAPILVKRCLECHGERQAEGGLVLATHKRALAGGDSGPVVVPGKLAESLLVTRLEAGEMPPEKKGQSQKLPPAEIEVIRAWIAAGAGWPEGRTLDLFERTTELRAGRDWWSLAPIRRPAIQGDRRQGTGDSGQAASENNAIDGFIRVRLEMEQMSPAPPADSRTLIRRLYFDVIGLPPSAERIDEFARDQSPDAYERLVDRLLAMPQFGERWARHWLDVVRFAETCGYERDQVKPHAWKYRDWVVRAINDDKPYDRFVLEQLAGDELPDRSEESVIATGFLRLGTWNDEPNDPQEYKYERLEDLVHATSSAFLGFTVKCARCHDHKFDPIWQTDYYRLAAAFWPGPIEPRERELLGGPKKEELGLDVLGWTDLTREPPPLFLLKKGDPRHPGPPVEPGQLSMVAALDRPIEPPAAGARTSQRRLQIARWIVDPANPLARRVVVNRLWLHHFGQGLVRSPNDFGFNGERPTHPELLDWLACELLQSGWSLKRLHRLTLNSATYRQSSLHPQYAECRERDAGNRLWWHAERRRLEAEPLRDAMLAASGELDLRIGGESFRPTISAEALEGLSRKTEAYQASPPSEQRRRSLYIFTQRSLLPPLMTVFDFSDTTLPCGQRDVTTVAPQALALLNNEFVHARSMALADRITLMASEGPQSPDRPIDLAWRLTLGRNPTERERQAALEHLTAQESRFSGQPQPKLLALASLCHVLLNTNEFLYVD